MKDGDDGRLPGKTRCGARRSTSSHFKPSRLQLRLGLCQCAPAHQRFGLRQAIGEQQVLMHVAVPARGLRADDELDRDDIRALMQQLEEGVLAVGAGFAPDDRAGGRRQPLSHPCVTRLPFDSMSSCCR